MVSNPGQQGRIVDDNPHTRDSQGLRGGVIPGSAGQPAFTLTRRDPSPIPVLVAVPHAGRLYPPALVGQMRHPGEAALRLEDRYVDLLATAIARETGAALLVAHAPRAMIDLNRAPDEMDWDMLRGGTPPHRRGERVSRRARSGLGLVPRRLPGMGELWRARLEEHELEARLEGVHRPYHEAISQSLATLRARWGAALLVDLHSMPPLGGRGPGEPAPHIVLGDRFGATCDGVLCAAAFDELNRQRRLAAHNRPYAGGYVLERHAAPACGIHAMQVEVCRLTYLDQRLAEPVEAMAGMIATLVALVRRLAAETAVLGRGAQLPQAAE